MKLPKNANIGQQSIAKVNSNLPTAVANAQAGANNSFGRALSTFGNVAEQTCTAIAGDVEMVGVSAAFNRMLSKIARVGSSDASSLSK